MPTDASSKSISSTALAVMQLVRAPNVFTAAADVSMGFLVSQRSAEPWQAFLGLCLASMLLYMAGMVLNDVYDLAVDREERPRRPLPSGRLSLRFANLFGYGLLFLGVALAGFSGIGFATTTSTPGLVAIALAITIVCYDGIFKKTPLAPFFMGSCRLLNVLLGMSLTAQGLTFESWQLRVALGIGIYIVGVTWFARTEARRSSRWLLACGAAWMALGVATLASLARQELPQAQLPPILWPLLLVLGMSPVIWKCSRALWDPSPKCVQAAIKPAVLSLIVLDAAVAWYLGSALWGLLILLLLVPTLLLGRWLYST